MPVKPSLNMRISSIFSFEMVPGLTVIGVSRVAPMATTARYGGGGGGGGSSSSPPAPSTSPPAQQAAAQLIVLPASLHQVTNQKYPP